MKKLREFKNGELFYNGYSLTSLAKKYGTPLKITFLDVIKEHIISLKQSFDKAIKELNYPAKFVYLNANKANYGGKEVLEAYKHADGLETSSYYDLLFTRAIYEDHNDKKKVIYCNGYKLQDYVDEIIDCFDNGFDITDIIDSVSEYEMLKASKKAIKVGLRVHLAALYAEEGEPIKNDRFGLTKEDYDYIIEDIKNTNLILTTIHFHQRGFDYEEEKFKINFEKAFYEYYVNAAKKYQSVVNFDMGGGTPLPTDGEFDYDAWAVEVIKILQEASSKNGVTMPNLLSENGKYSQKDSTVNVYKVVGKKNTDEITWNIVDSSLLIALPEMYALGEPIDVMPINNLDKKMVKSYLAGITCDCDDVYFEKDKGCIMLPDVDDLYIGCIGTGSYQNSMNGKGGVHHCLLPEEIDLVISEGKEEIRANLQSIDEIMKLNKYRG